MIIVNFATGVYRKGQKRLSESLNGHKQLMLSDYTSLGSPPHTESPYQFKTHAIETAWNHDPIVLWVDASMWLVGDISVIENIIKQDGYFMSEAGHWVGSWCNQYTRDYFQLTPEESKVPGGFCMFSAGLLGLDRNNPLAFDFFTQWKQSALAGCFRGSHTDHRHDMTCASIIASRLKMKYQRGGQHMSYIGPGYSDPEPGTVFFLQGIV